MWDSVNHRIKVDGSAVTQPVSGTVVANIGTMNGLALDSTLVGGSQQTKITNGTTVVDTVAGDSGNNALITTRGRKEVSFSTTSAQAVASTEVSNYSYVSVHIVTQGTSSVIHFQASNDNTNWLDIALLSAASTGNTLAATQTGTGVAGTIYHGPLAYRYFRLNVTGITAGTTSGVIEFFSNPPGTVVTSTTATQQGTWTNRIVGNTGAAVDAAVGAGTAPANMVAVGGLYNSTEISPTSGQSSALQIDSKGRLRQVMMDAAGNTRGANVTSGNALVVDGSNVTQPMDLVKQTILMQQVALLSAQAPNGFVPLETPSFLAGV